MMLSIGLLPLCIRMSLQSSRQVLRSRCMSTLESQSERCGYLRKQVEEEIKLDNEWILGATSKESLSKGAVGPTAHIHAGTGSEYLSKRGFELASDSEFRVLTSLTTFPLSLAYGITLLSPYFGGDNSNSRNSTNSSDSGSLDVLVIGARAESSLPLLWWREALFAAPSTINSVKLQFIGPHILPKRIRKSSAAEAPDQIFNWTLSSNNEAIRKSISLSLVEGAQCCLHEHSDVTNLLQASNLFVLFNPGMGANTQLQLSWKESILLLLRTGKPIIITALNERDMQRDFTYIQQLIQHESICSNIQLNVNFAPHKNPYLSHKRSYDDKEIEECKEVHGNSWIYVIRGILK